MQLGDIGIRKQSWIRTRRIEGTDALLAAGHPQQLLIDRPVPPPAEAGLQECLVERLPVQFFGFRQRAIDVEDQCVCAAEQILRVLCVTASPRHDRRWLRHRDVCGLAAAPAKTRLASTSTASIDITSSLVRTRSSRETRRLA